MIILKYIILFIVANVFVAVVFKLDDIKEIEEHEKNYNHNPSNNYFNIYEL